MDPVVEKRNRDTIKEIDNQLNMIMDAKPGDPYYEIDGKTVDKKDVDQSLKDKDFVDRLKNDDVDFRINNDNSTAKKMSDIIIEGHTSTSVKKPTESEKGVDKTKEELIAGGKLELDSEGNVIEVRQNSGYPSQLFKDLNKILGDDKKALDEYLKIKNDEGDFKKKFGDWENSIMKDYGRSRS